MRILFFEFVFIFSRIRRNLSIHIARFSASESLRVYTNIFQEYEETCLFILARFSASESLRVFINILKFPPPFASNEGYPASGFRYESAGALVSNPLPHSSSLATARRRVLISSRFLYLFLPLFLYIVIFILNYYFYSDIITL